MESFQELSQGVIAGKDEIVRNLVNALVAEGKAPVEIINNGLIAGMSVVGIRFKDGDMYVPEVLMSARAMNAGLEIVKLLIADGDIKKLGKVLLGTVKGDLHDIGKNLVSMMLESGGLEVINLGVDVSPEKFIDAVKRFNPDIVAMSALLTTTTQSMKETIELLIEEGLRDKVKVIVGGAPLSADFANSIGADGYAPDAGSATELCKKLLGV